MTLHAQYASSWSLPQCCFWPSQHLLLELKAPWGFICAEQCFATCAGIGLGQTLLGMLKGLYASAT